MCIECGCETPKTCGCTDSCTCSSQRESAADRNVVTISTIKGNAS